MANGKIKADTLEHSTAGSLDTQYVVHGSAKAWINIDMINAVTLDSFNSSSITDFGTGQFRDHLVTGLVNANYAVTTSAMDPTKTDNGGTNRTADGTPSSTVQFVMRASAYDNTANDVPSAAGVAHGDLT